MNLKPLADRVVLKRTEAEEKTKGGIILTSAAQEKPEVYEVIVVGPGGMVDGNEVKMEVKAGDKVIAGKYSGTSVKLDGEEYKRPKKLRGDALIDGWYNRKRIGLEKSFDLGGDAFSQKLPEILVSAYAELMPMYEYFMEIYRACPETGRPAPRGTGNAAE